MDKLTLEALKDSIEKWRQIERGEMADMGITNCMLCQQYYSAPNCMLCQQYYSAPKGYCDGCPVSGKTGKRYCEGSPYEQWCYIQAQRKFDIEVADTPELVRIARAERKFLESLLP